MLKQLLPIFSYNFLNKINHTNRKFYTEILLLTKLISDEGVKRGGIGVENLAIHLYWPYSAAALWGKMSWHKNEWFINCDCCFKALYMSLLEQRPFSCYLSRLMTKPTKWHMHPAKTQISLGIRPVWSESLLSAWRKVGSLAIHWVHSKDSGCPGWSEFSLGTQSFCWFCHEAAHLSARP